MKKTTLSFALLSILITVLLAACQQSTSSTPTQTPVFVVVEEEDAETDESDEDAEDTEEEVVAVAADDEDTPRSLPDEEDDDNIDCDAGVVEQVFENGRMFWVGRSLNERCSETHEFLPNTGEIWVVIFDEDDPTTGEWLAFVDAWDEETDPEDDTSIEVPDDDLQRPVRGFGLVWREELTDAQRDALGFATQEELGYITDYEYEFETFTNAEDEEVARPGTHKIETLGGEAFFFEERTGDFIYDEDD